MKGWRWGNFAAVAALFGLSYALHVWRGGFSTSFLTCSLGILLVLSLLPMAEGIRGMRFERRISRSQLFAGEELAVELVVERSGRAPFGWLVITDVWSDGTDEFRHSRLSFPGQRSHWRSAYAIRRPARGKYRFLRVEAVAGDWLGLLQRVWTIPLETTVTVYPRPLLPVSESKPVVRTAVQPTTAKRSIHLEMSAAFDVGTRPYQAGDPPKRIDWKASARAGELHTRRLEPPEAGKVALLLDVSPGPLADLATSGVDMRLETAIRAAAGLADRSVRRGADVGMLTVLGDKLVRLPLARRARMEEMLDLLSQARIGGSPQAAELLLHGARDWPADCELHLVTRAADERLVQAARLLRSEGRALTVWLVVAAGQGANESAGAETDELRACGCRVVPVPVVAEAWQWHELRAGGEADDIA